MLPPKWIVFLVAFWVVATIVCLTCEGAWLGVEQQTVLSQFLECEMFTNDSIWGKIAGVFSPTFWGGLLNMVTFNYAIFYGSWAIFKWIVLMPITVMVMYSLLWGTAKLIRGTGGF